MSACRAVAELKKGAPVIPQQTFRLSFVPNHLKHTATQLALAVIQRADGSVCGTGGRSDCGPTEADYKRMDPEKAKFFEGGRGKAAKKQRVKP